MPVWVHSRFCARPTMLKGRFLVDTALGIDIKLFVLADGQVTSTTTIVRSGRSVAVEVDL